ncbi:putative hGE-14 protein [Anaplasma phagocytophilum str. ApMUC09]|uniref:Putative hGE-14 protein n=1 Tax=Anaplasma phagocytophilum str. ApMUC09 TaxID=1359152 RepID=A0A0F3N8W6_ANAPH|nr:putative hGE-14 protein [Anaplasma phagocytophilum str. ApMUC09]
MHTPRIFTSPGMSGYAYSGLSSREYKDSLCRAITTGLMSYEEFLKVLRECVAELRNTFSEIRGVDAVFAKHADRVELLASYLDEEGTASADPAVRERVLYELAYDLCDTLYDCATASCNRDVALFMDPCFIRHRAHLQIAKVCGILVNSIAIVNCCIRDLVAQSVSVAGEREDSSTFRAALALSAHVNVQFSGLSRCLNSSLGPEEVKHRKAILRMVRHNIELCNKVAELFDPNMLRCFRDRTKRCLNGILNVVESTSAECKEMVCNNESVRRRLAIARKALLEVQCHFKVYRKLAASHDFQRFNRGENTRALVHVTGSLFSMYRGYASTGNTDHVIAGIIGHCLKILLSLPGTRRGIGAYGARKVYVDMCSVYEDIEQRARPELLLNPGAEVRWRDAALRYLSEMMEIWERKYGKYFNVVEQTGGSPSQPSTSGLGSTRAGMGRSQAPHMPPHYPGIMPHAYAQPSTSYAQPSTSWDQPSTSGLGGAAGLGQQAPYIPPHDPGIMFHAYAQPSTSYAHPSTSWDQPSTSGFGSTRAGMGRSQAPYVLPHDPGIMPHAYSQPSTSYAQPSTSWDQPSTSGLGGAAGVGRPQAPYIPPHDPGIMFHAYAQPSTSYAHPSTSWDQPSTSGLGGAAGLGQQAPYIPPHDPGIMFHAYAQPSTSYAHPSTSWDQPSTSGFGSTRAGMGRSQAPYVLPHDPGIMPHAYSQPSTSYAQPSTSWDQPSTSGLGGAAGVGRPQAPYIPPHDPGIMFHAYAQPSTSYAHPSTSWDQPSTSGFGGASSTLEEAQVSTHRSQTPDDDEDEQPSKRARYR